MKGLTERAFSHHGAHYDIPPGVPYRGYELADITLVPKPLKRPLECWQPIVSANPKGLDFMVRHGIKGVIGGGAAPAGPQPRPFQRGETPTPAGAARPRWARTC